MASCLEEDDARNLDADEFQRRRNSVLAISVWVDEQSDDGPTWYGVMKNYYGDVVDDTMKIWAKVDVADYSFAQAGELRDALVAAYPGATVEVLPG